MDDFENDWRNYMVKKRYEWSQVPNIILLQHQLVREQKELERSDIIRRNGHEHKYA